MAPTFKPTPQDVAQRQAALEKKAKLAAYKASFDAATAHIDSCLNAPISLEIPLQRIDENETAQEWVVRRRSSYGGTTHLMRAITEYYATSSGSVTLDAFLGQRGFELVDGKYEKKKAPKVVVPETTRKEFWED